MCLNFHFYLFGPCQMEKKFSFLNFLYSIVLVIPIVFFLKILCQVDISILMFGKSEDLIKLKTFFSIGALIQKKSENDRTM